MATLHMTVDPHLTHTILDLSREHLWCDGNVAKIEQLFREGFGITNQKLISKIVRGEYVMVFNEDGSGNLVPNEDLTEEQIEKMGGRPEIWTREKLAGMLRRRLMYYYRNATDITKSLCHIRDIHKEFDFPLQSTTYELANPILKKYPEMEMDVYAKVSVGTLLNMFVHSKTDKETADMCRTIEDSNSSAGMVLVICRKMEEVVEDYRRWINIMDYIEQWWEKDIQGFDTPRFEGKFGWDEDELRARPWAYTHTLYKNLMTDELLQQWQYISGDEILRKQVSAQFVGQDAITEAYMKNYAAFCDRQKDAKNDPVKIDAMCWDAGWISPDGKVWAECGEAGNMIHVVLARRIFEYMNYELPKDEWNADRELEARGWVKFHHQEVAFTGYQETGLAGRHKITNRQKDRLQEYARRMGYTEFTNLFASKSFKVEDIHTISEEEWEDIFNW